MCLRTNEIRSFKIILDGLINIIPNKLEMDVLHSLINNKLWKVFLIKINKKRYENTITLWWKTFTHQSLAAKRIMKIIFSVLWIFNLRLQVHGCLQHKHVMVIIGRKVGRKWIAPIIKIISENIFLRKKCHQKLNRMKKSRFFY